MTITETAMVFLIIIGLSLDLSTNHFGQPMLVDQFKSDVLHTQLLAMMFFKSVELPHLWGIDVRFNANGNVNEPIRVRVGHCDVLIRLGTGRFDVARLSND